MTTIKELREIIDYTRSLSNKAEKLDYLNKQDRDVLNFLSKNIKKDGVALAIASEIPISKLSKSASDMEYIIGIFKSAANTSKRNDKIRLMKGIWLVTEDRELVLTILYGSLKLGVTIPIQPPEFGDVIKPQLCGTGIEFNPYQMIVETKFDGIRCLATNNKGEITLQSRNGKVLNVPVITRSLTNSIPPGTTVDGEIVSSDGKFESLDRKSNNLIYQIFDILFCDEKPIVDYPLIVRREILYEDIKENGHIKISQELSLSSMNEINNWINKTGAEGIVAKDPESTYKYGDRKAWIKVKPFLDCTCNVISYTEGIGKRKGIMGAINVIPEGSEVLTKVGSGFTDEKLIEMKQRIDGGKKITVDVKYQNLTNDGCLRFPIFLRIREINGEEI